MLSMASVMNFSAFKKIITTDTNGRVDWTSPLCA
jgi:hypothetical protein